MSFDKEKLYNLLPAIYRIRDAEQGEPLKALLSVIAGQVAVLEENLEQLYDDQFIETSADWVVPYIGDLIGYRQIHGVAPGIGSPRAEVANTIAYRRRKGTAAMIEQLARDVTGWNARVVEFFQLLAWTQYMNHIRPGKGGTLSLRYARSLEFLHGPFEDASHTVDVRRIAGSRGRYNIPNIGIFLWRLNAYSLTDSPAFKMGDRRYLFSPLGNNAPLFTRPETEEEITHLAEPVNVPMPISRRMLDRNMTGYYGSKKSLFILRDGLEVPVDNVMACDLSDKDGTWAHLPLDKVAIDPVLGRIAFPQSQSPPKQVQVTFHYGFSTEMGGGEYERRKSFDSLLQPVKQVTAPGTIQSELEGVKNGGVVEIGDSGRYAETLKIEVNAGRRLEVRAANKQRTSDNGCRPTLVMDKEMIIAGGVEGEITLNGLLITGGSLHLKKDASNQLRRLRLRHCTLDPTIQPSLIVEIENVAVEIDHCIVGGLRVVNGASTEITNSIVDATSETGVAYADTDTDAKGAGGRLRIENSTVVGKVHTVAMELASNTIFLAALAEGDTSWTAPIRAEQKQEGCVRFCYLPADSRVPRRYRCQPDLAIQKAVDAALEKKPELTTKEKDLIADGIRAWLKPAFADRRYGQPAYCQSGNSCPIEIRTGADDEAEMGAFHDLYQPQRETNLRTRLDEYLRFGLEAGIFYAT